MHVGGRSWSIWLICTIFVAFQLFIGMLYGIAINQLSSSLAISSSDVSKLVSIYFLAYAVMQIPMGVIMDKFSSKYVLTISALIISLGLFIIAGTHSFGIASFASIIMGAASSSVFIGAIIMNSRWFPEKMFSIVTGMTSGFNGLIAAVIGFFIVRFINIGSLQISITAILGIIIAVFILFIVKNRPVEIVGDGNVKAKTGIWQMLAKSIANKQIIYATLGTTFVYGSMLAFITFWNFDYQLKYNLSMSTITLLNITILAGLAVGAPISGLISERMHKRKPVALFMCICLFIVLIVVLQPIDIPTPLLFIVMFILGLFSNNVAVGFSMIKENSESEYVGTAIAFANTILFLGLSALQFVPGELITFFNSHQSIFFENKYITHDLSLTSNALYIFPIVVILAFICFFLSKETHCKTVKH